MIFLHEPQPREGRIAKFGGLFVDIVERRTANDKFFVVTWSTTLATPAEVIATQDLDLGFDVYFGSRNEVDDRQRKCRLTPEALIELAQDEQSGISRIVFGTSKKGVRSFAWENEAYLLPSGSGPAKLHSDVIGPVVSVCGPRLDRDLARTVYDFMRVNETHAMVDTLLGNLGVYEPRPGIEPAGRALSDR